MKLLDLQISLISLIHGVYEFLGRCLDHVPDQIECISVYTYLYKFGCTRLGEKKTTFSTDGSFLKADDERMLNFYFTENLYVFYLMFLKVRDRVIRPTRDTGNNEL